ncbi:hypothetical protein DO021_07215 [Desulfobacter hydrogenophilus]|uniref:Formylmethanofuran dehydrogenase subunit E domain-containing protein n=1 Tax=Desulfobacter hydrogenophilus TaxID=2291 RepID=A0A328FHM6_9BACT|nr:hypothetical protein [Desulfobacter hydrogenophilus]NDY71848.1 hypothetical protein [Desulfobacter hydrogenophilus]QBH12018.1 hypothetical protein EYB58_03210 [Desulfobacter hydrogenophilus]RAM02623.1 hypothetical protein DO021_07215 [Desulfobacter hydrogenophilus]
MKISMEKQSWRMLAIALLSMVIPVVGTANGAENYPKMQYPAFFDKINPIVLKDPLGEFIGTSQGGILEITYVDTVKMAGHSCAVVGGAYLAAREGLKALYGEELPRRGEIKVEIRHGVTQDNAGVVGSVISNITGATTDFGFEGLPGGRFNRRNLLFYNAPIDTDIRFTRLDTNRQVGINYHSERAVNPKAILMSAIGPDATPESKRSFPERFQNMVKQLFEQSDRVIEVIEFAAPAKKDQDTNG